MHEPFKRRTAGGSGNGNGNGNGRDLEHRLKAALARMTESEKEARSAASECRDAVKTSEEILSMARKASESAPAPGSLAARIMDFFSRERRHEHRGT